MEKTMPIKEARDHLSEVIDRVESVHERVVITRHGKPAAVLVAVDDLASMEETMSILAQPGAADEIRRAKDEMDQGDYVTLDELEELMRRRRRTA